MMLRICSKTLNSLVITGTLSLAVKFLLLSVSFLLKIRGTDLKESGVNVQRFGLLMEAENKNSIVLDRMVVPVNFETDIFAKVNTDLTCGVATGYIIALGLNVTSALSNIILHLENTDHIIMASMDNSNSLRIIIE